MRCRFGSPFGQFVRRGRDRTYSTVNTEDTDTEHPTEMIGDLAQSHNNIKFDQLLRYCTLLSQSRSLTLEWLNSPRELMILVY